MQSEIKLAQELSDGLRRLQDTARRIIEVSQECKVTIDAGKFDVTFT